MENFSTFVRTLGTQFVRGKKFFTTQIGVLGRLTDNTGSAGTAGKVLSSTGSGVQWITLGGGTSNVADLDDLTDVVITTASSGQLLRFNGTSWVNWTPNFLTAYGSLNDLSDVTLTTPLNGARLIYSSATSQWIDANPLGINKIYYGTSSGDSATTNVITNGTRLSVGTFAMPTNLNVGQVDITTGIIGEGSIHIGGVADEEVYLLASRNKIQVGSQIVTFVPGEGGGEQGTTTTTFTASTLNIQPIGGQTVFGGLVTATGFKTPSGTSLGFLKADGSVDTTQYLPSGEIDLDDLSDVIITSPSTGQILRYELPIGEFIPAWRNVTPGYLTPNSSIDSLVDVAISGAAADQLLRWNGTYWINWTPNFLTSFTETDPTVPAHVKDISTTDISSWDAGYNDSIRGISFNTSTGVLTLTQMDLGTLTVDLDGRYLESYTETDPVFSASPAAGIEGQSIEKWDQAFSWGDHSLVGYLTEESDTLDTVTSRGNTTANTIDVGGITTPYVQFEEVEEAHGIARSINWSEDHNSLEVFYADEKHFDVGQDQMWHVKNGDEDTLLKGTVVMAIGAVGNSGKLEVAPLVADGTVSGRYAIGILMDNIRSGEFGFVMTQGKLRGIDTGEFTEGDTLYPDPLIPGALVNVEPASPALKLPIAFVVSSHNNGAIAVRMTQGLDLHEVHDVQITSPVNGQILRLETGVWTNWTPSYIEAETDPVFIASPAANITVGAIEKWDTAYSWGDHSLIGYLTSFTETDPTVPAHVKSITEQNIIDWNGAYGWGDHASAGYLTSYENNYISNVKLSESTLEFTGIGSAFNSTVDLSTLPFAPQGSYLTAEADTLQSVTTRGSSTTTGATFGGNVGIGTTAPSYKLDVTGGSTTSRRGFSSPRFSSAGEYNYGVTNSPTWNVNKGAYTNNNATSPDGTTTAGTYTLTTVSWDLYQTIAVTEGVEYTVGAWVKLGTATNFCIVMNNTISWNTIGGKAFDSSDGLSTSKWTHISFTFTGPENGSVNLHIGAHSENAVPQQTAGTVFLWNWEMSLLSSTWIGKVDDEIRLPGSSIWTSRGNVGIGTTEPNAKLYVKGNAIDNVGLTVLENDYSSGDIYYPTLSVINTRGNHSYGIVAEFRINTAADTDRPTILFYGEQASHSWQIGQVTSGWGSADSFGIGYRASNDPTSFNSWPTSYFTILTGGNVGIGTTSPSNKLTVYQGGGVRVTGIASGDWIEMSGDLPGYSANQYPVIKSNGTIHFANNNKYSAFLEGANTYFGILDNTTTTRVFLATSGNTYFTGGNVGIGTTEPSTKLDVSGVITATDGNSTNWNTAYGWGNHVTAGYFKLEGEEPITIQAETVTFTGDVTVEGTFTESSSIRFKENITPLDPALDKVNQLEAVSYNKIGVDDREIGLIAEDVAELFPEVVTYNEEGQHQGIQYQRLSVILLKAVQELSQEVNELKKKLN